MTGFLFFLFLALGSLSMSGQNIAEHIKEAKTAGEMQDFVTMALLLNDISEEDILSEPDSIRYDFYYMNAALMVADENTDKVKLVEEIDKALKIRERSLGVQHPEYLELLAHKGYNLEEEDPAAASKAYQKALIVGQDLVNRGDVAIDYWFANIQSSLADLYSRRGFPDMAEALYIEAFSIINNNYIPGTNEFSWVPLLSLSQLYFNEGKPDEAIATCDRLLQFFSERGGYPSPEYGLMASMKAYYLGETGRYGEAVEWRKKALENHQGIPDPDSEEVANAFLQLYLAMIVNKDFGNADSLETQITDFSYLKENSELLLDMFFNASTICDTNGDPVNAEKYIMKALPYSQTPHDDYTEFIYSQASLYRLNNNDLDGAWEYKQKALEASADRDSELKNRIDLLYIQSYRDPVEALAGLKALKEEMTLRNEQGSPRYINLLHNLIPLMQRSAGPQEIIDYFLTDYEEIADKFGKTNPLVITYDNIIGVSYVFLGKGEEALPYMENYRKGVAANSGEDNIKYGTALHNLGRALMLTGDNEGARENLLKARSLQLKYEGEVDERTSLYLKELGIE